MPVNTPNKEYLRNVQQWKRCRDCYAGADAVKHAGVEYLPKLGSHTTDPRAYDAYKARAEFYNATARTVNGMAGAILGTAPAVSADEVVFLNLEDVTLAGNSLEGFAADIAKDVLLVGRAGILVEMPDTPAPDSRPYWTMYATERIVSWKTTRIFGVDTVVRVVLCEEIEDENPKDQFETVDFMQYRVLTIESGFYEQVIYREMETAGRKSWVEVDRKVPMKTGRPLAWIPFVFVGPSGTSAKVHRSPLLDLVDLNLSHYRTMADLEHGRHLTALPTPWVAGMEKPEAEAQSGKIEIDIGSSTIWFLEKGGQAGMLEYTGQGLGALERADETKRKKMASLGARLLEDPSSGGEAAVTVGMRHAGEQATLRGITQVLESALTTCLKYHSWWMGKGVALGEDNPDKVKASVELNKDYFAVKATAAEISSLLLNLQAETISYKTFYAALQKGGWARENVTADDELLDISADSARFAPPPPPPPPPVPGP